MSMPYPLYSFSTLLYYFYYDIVLIVEQKEDFKSALEKFQALMVKQEDEVEKIPEKDLLGLTYHNVGVLHMFLGKVGEAIEYIEKAIEAKSVSFGEEHHLVAVSESACCCHSLHLAILSYLALAFLKRTF